MRTRIDHSFVKHDVTVRYTESGVEFMLRAGTRISIDDCVGAQYSAYETNDDQPLFFLVPMDAVRTERVSLRMWSVANTYGGVVRGFLDYQDAANYARSSMMEIIEVEIDG